MNKSFDRERKQTDIEFINSLYERANSAQALLKWLAKKKINNNNVIFCYVFQ